MVTDYQPSKALQAALNFQSDDFAANRAGQLSQRQMANLRELGRPFRNMLVILGVFAVLVGTPLLLFAGSSPDMPLLFLITMMVPGGLGGLAAMRLNGIRSAIGGGQVASVEGLAHTYTKRSMRGGVAYYVRVGQREFFVNRALQDAFEPGRAYRIFYTPRGNVPVSGEFAPEPASTTQASRFADPHFTGVFGFTQQDLDLNRVGQLSTMQRATIRQNRNHDLFVGLVSGAVLAGLLWLWTLMNSTPTLVLGFGLFSLFPALLLLFSLWSALQRTRDLRSGDVGHVSGFVRRIAARHGMTHRQPSYALEVGGIRLNVKLDVYGAFAEGGNYTLYYTAHSRQLLAAEPLDAPAGQ